MKAKIIPVIHIINEDQVRENIDLVLSRGLNMVFLIHHHDPEITLPMAQLMRKQYPDLWIGINILGSKIQKTLLEDFKGIDALWSDNSMSEFTEDEIKGVAAQRKFDGILFGGVAFKYQPQPKNLREACEKAMLIVDVVTTSGSATGSAAEIGKIENMRKYLGKFPMAIASGITAENVSRYSDLVEWLLVATSITNPSTEKIIPEELDKLLAAL